MRIIGRQRPSGRLNDSSMNTTESQPAAPKPKRRWYQYSLRTLLLAFVLFALAMGWVETRLQRAQQQRAAVERINGLGGFSEYDYDYNYNQSHPLENGPLGLQDPPGSPRLRKLLGDDLFNGLAGYWIAEVDFPRYAWEYRRRVVQTDVHDEDLFLLGNLPMLRCVNLTFQPISDAGLERLSGLKNIENLQLYGTKITDKAVETLAKLPSLERLDVGATQINPVTLARLLGRKKLTYLELSTDQVDTVGGGKAVEALFPDVQVVRLDWNKDGRWSSQTPP